MKTFRFLAFCALLPLAATAQITIGNGDMPSPGDTIRISNGLVTANIDPVPTGANYTWNFSTLQFVDQTIDTFLSIGQTSGTYSVVYVNIALNPNRANLAAKANLSFPALPGLTVEDVYGFYYNSSASYKQVGLGATVNGLATPMPFGNKDVIYTFPLDYNDTDSSDSDLSLSIPNLGYYGFDQHRVNVCEGWGTLITPFGTFSTLKVKSTLHVHDTVFVTSAGFGLGQDRPVTHEYKWLGKGKGLPLLEIITTEVGGTEAVTSIRYQDSARSPLATDVLAFDAGLTVYPVPAREAVQVSFVQQHAGTAAFSLCDLAGREVLQFDQDFTGGRRHVSVPVKDLPKGLYLLGIRINGQQYVRKVAVE